jgi:hypothetical protein
MRAAKQKASEAGWLFVIGQAEGQGTSDDVLAHGPNAPGTHVLAHQATVLHHLDALNVGAKLPLGLPV